jgi:hypothetical protein
VFINVFTLNKPCLMDGGPTTGDTATRGLFGS